MQRYSQGLQVPKHMIESFIGKVTDGTGKLTLDLTYTPTSIHDILDIYGHDIGNNPRFFRKFSLTGRALVVIVEVAYYYKTVNPTSVDVGSTGAAGNHSHAITYTTPDVQYSMALVENQGTITVEYKVG